MGGRGAVASRRLVWVLAACGPVLLVAGAALSVHHGAKPTTTEWVTNIYPNVVFGALMPLLGALILSRLPGHPIGRLFVFCGLAAAATLPVYGYAWRALYDHQDIPGGLFAGWVSSWLWTLGFAPLMTLGVLLFPDGSVPTPRWRLLLRWDLAALTLLTLSAAMAPGPLSNHPVADNPLGLPVDPAVFHVAGGIAFAMVVGGFIGGAASAVVRWRRGGAVERAQLGLFALAVVLIVAALLLPGTVLPYTLTIVAMPLLPLAVAVAILRRNLYGIEVVVRRSLVYGTLTALLLLAYTAVIALLGTFLEGQADRVVALVAAALIAIAFAPVRDWLQRAVGRMLYGEGADPYAVLSGLGRRLDESWASYVDVLGEVSHAVASSLRLPYVAIEGTGPGRESDPLRASWGMPVDHLLVLPISFRGREIGRLSVAPRTPHDDFRPADLRLLDDLARQIGVTLQAVVLNRDLQRSREELVTAREEERRRIRRDLHDGLGPALAGIALGLDGIGQLAATRPEEASELAGQLKHEVHGSLADVRRLVEDLRPPELDQFGLVGAVRRHGDRLTARDPGLEVDVDAGTVGPLPAAVEVAAYRIVTEALTNVARHAQARHCRVELSVEADALNVRVDDDGRGLPEAVQRGVGLTAMRERAMELGGSWDAAGQPEGGTRVVVRLPLAVP